MALWRAIVRALTITAQPSISTDAGSPGPRGWAAFEVRLNPRLRLASLRWRRLDEATRHAFPSGLEIDGRRGRIDPSLGAAHALETRI